jgi:hypothetical protein
VAAVTRSPKVRTQLGRNAGAGLCRSAFYCEIALMEFDRTFDNRFTATYRFAQPPKIRSVFKGDTERIAWKLSGHVISATTSEKRRRTTRRRWLIRLTGQTAQRCDATMAIPPPCLWWVRDRPDCFLLWSFNDAVFPVI